MVQPAAHRERELKLRLPGDVVLPDALAEGRHRPGSADLELVARPDVHLTAVYHDTHDARLARWGVTLRRRIGGEDEGWHLKLPPTARPDVGGHAHLDDGLADRLELALPLTAGEVGEVPDVFGDLVAALAREQPLVPQARVETVRRRWLVRATGASAELAELTDDAVTVARGERDGAGSGTIETFREVEVEEVPDGVGAVGAEARSAVGHLAGVLVARGAVPSTRTKGQRALGVVAEGPPDVVVPEVGAGSSAAEVTHAVVAAQVRALLFADVAVRRDGEDAVHRFRVAARTLRSALRTFAPLVEAGWAEDLRAELAWAAGALGQARDAEVQLALLTALAGEALGDAAGADGAPIRVARDAVVAELEARYRTARAAGLAVLRSRRYGELLVRLVAAARAPRVTPAAQGAAEEVLGPLVDRAVRRASRAIRRLEVAGDAATWHRARILAKRARYGADALAMVGSHRGRALAVELERVTDALGDLHDDDVTRGVLAGLTGPAVGAGPAAVVAGEPAAVVAGEPAAVVAGEPVRRGIERLDTLVASRIRARRRAFLDERRRVRRALRAG